ncbi:MAG TPA: pilin [Candidatus Saccharimonadales bacterium]|nr:pilin [Candidatus Saccharimonadales bacterium]
MFSLLRKKLATIGVSLGLALVPMAVPLVVSAQTPPATTDPINSNLECGSTLSVEAGGDCSGDVSTGSGRIQNIVTTIVNIFSIVVGIVAVIMIIVGGFKYITSGGDSGNITSAKNTIVYAVIGLVIVALAQFIVQFVLTRVNNNAA